MKRMHLGTSSHMSSLVLTIWDIKVYPYLSRRNAVICQYILEAPISIGHSTAVNKGGFGLQSTYVQQQARDKQIYYCCKVCADITCEGVRKWDNTAQVVLQISGISTQWAASFYSPRVEPIQIVLFLSFLWGRWEIWPKLFFSKDSQEVISLLTGILEVYDFSSFFIDVCTAKNRE